MNSISYYNTQLKELLKKALKKGALDIFVSSMLNKVLMLVANILLVRLMEKSDFGVYSFVYNIITIVMIVSTLGLDTAMMQFCCEKREETEKRQLERFTIIAGVSANFIFSILTACYALIFPLSIPEAKWALVSFAFILPLTCILNYQKYILRIRLDNRKFSLLTNISSIAYLVASVALIPLWNLGGAISGRYLGFLIPIIVGAYYIKGSYKEISKSTFPSKVLIRQFVKFGLTIALTNGISELLYYLDVYVVGIFTTDTIAIANYKSATLIPRALAMLPTMLMIFVYPYFAYNKDNHPWVRSNTLKIQAISLPVCVLIALPMYVFAPQLIQLLYGADYLDSTIPFQILVVSFVFSAVFRVIAGNILAMLGRVNANLVMGTIECVLNVVLDFVLIKYYGCVGAAFATLIVTVISALMTNGYLYYVLKK